jgi:glucose/arabinose dehydrogenase
MAGIRTLTVSVVLSMSMLIPMASMPARAAEQTVRTGKAAFGDWTTDAPGVRRKITVADLPPPFATESSGNFPRVVAPPDDAMPKVPSGFKVEKFAVELDGPRLLRVAPNGDIFIAESHADRIRLVRVADTSSKPDRIDVFAAGLNEPFGIAFWPPGPNPKFVYVGNTGSVVRFPYQVGDLHARGPAEVVVPNLPSGGRLTGGGHWTRDVVFSRDGSKLFVSVGSRSNDAEHFARLPLPESVQYAKMLGLGSVLGSEEHRADVLEFKPDGTGERTYATGLRNCVGMAINPTTSDLWCSTNERDGMGDDLPPDYITHVQDGGFYGWPWYYIGNHEDPRHKGERPDLASKVIVPDVLVEAHSASLQMTFYDGHQFPEEYRGDGFAAEHGSWNRARRTGYKIIRVIMRDGKPTGEYEDFMTGFVTPDGNVWGRPVGVAVAQDGSLVVTEDGNGTMWRISYAGWFCPCR